MFTIYRMGNEIIYFCNNEVEKHKFHQHKFENSPTLISDVDMNKIVVSNKVSFG